MSRGARQVRGGPTVLQAFTRHRKSRRRAPYLVPRASEAADPLGREPDPSRNERQHLVPLEYHLRDPLAMSDLERMFRGVAHDDAPLIGEIRVHGARRIGNTQPLLERGAAPRPDLRLVAVRQPRLEAEWNQRHHSGAQHDATSVSRYFRRDGPATYAVGALDRLLLQIGEQVVARRALGRAARRLRVVVQQLDHYRVLLPRLHVRASRGM